MIRTQVKQKIIEALEKVYPEHKKVPFNIFEPSADIEADLCTNLAMLLAQVMGYPPVQIAHRICEHLTPGSLIQSMAVSHHGYINIRLNPEFLYRFLSGICSGQHSFLHPTLDSHKPKVLIEFVSANPTGPLHIGHGRGAALGDCLARIYRQLGYGVDTEYYINDVGVQMQILAQSVGARYAQLESGNASHPFPENGYQGKYIEDIATIMRDRKQNNFDSFPKDYILDWIRKDLALFGVEFTQWFSEKTLYEQKKIDAILDLLRSKNSLKEKEGALWFVPPGSKEQGRTDPDRVLRKSDGSYTYFTSDIAYHQNKFERGYEYCIDIWGHDHHGYVPRVELALQTLGHSKDRLKLLLYQLVSLKWGGKRIAMSTRAGQFITLRTIIEEVGVDACRFFFCNA
jgi:arginyl-tRNA synthetase